MIYVMSDIHGCLNRYRNVLRQIRLRKDDHLYILGDVIDRGPEGHNGKRQRHTAAWKS